MVVAFLLLNFAEIVRAQNPETSAKGAALAKSAVKIGQSNCPVLLEIFHKPQTSNERVAEVKFIGAGKVSRLLFRTKRM
jgi:hypothetical protein